VRSWQEFTTETFEVRSRSGKAFAGISGEALELDTPLKCKSRLRGLRVFVREGNLTAAEQPQSRDLSVGELVSLAGGVGPPHSGR